MNETPRLDPARGAAIRSMLTETVRLTPRPRIRPGVFVFASLATAAVVIAVGVGYAATGVGHHPGIANGPEAAPSSAPSAQQTPVPTPSDEPGNLSQAGTPSPTPIPDPVDPADPSTWKITFDGVGPLTIGGPQKEQADLLSTFAREGDLASGCPALFFTKSPGLGLTTTSGQVANVTTFIAVHDSGLEPDGLSRIAALTPKTESGIGIGTTLGEVQRAYPALKFTGDYGTYQSYYAIDNGRGRYMIFTILGENHLVSAITLDARPTPPGEYCE